MPTTVEEQLAIYLTNAHSIELQALVQVERAKEMAGDPELAAAFDKHVERPETNQFVDRVQPLIDHPFDVTRTHLLFE